MKAKLFVVLMAAGLTASGMAVEDPMDRGLDAYNKGDYKTAYDFTVPLANQGFPKALNLLGMMYELGRGVPMDPAQSVAYYREAAEKGDLYAQFNLGVSYDEGLGIPQNFHEAVKWYRMAAEQGASFAQYNLGVMYEEGRGTERDYAEAAKWYQKAALQGYKQAQNNLAWLYESGNGVNKDLTAAYAWFDVAAKQGVQPAAEKMATVAAELTPEDMEKAKSLAAKFEQQYVH